MRNENFIIIQGWMVNELNLKGNDLLVYSVIYSFTQGKGGVCSVSLSYFQKSLNISKNTVLKSLNFLIEKGLIEKKQEEIRNVTFNHYFVNIESVQFLNNRSENNNKGCSETGGGVVQNLKKDSSETEHNNTIQIDGKSKEEKKSLFPENEIDLSIQILNYLNEKKPSKISFKPTPQNLKDIKIRIKEKYSFDDFAKVIDFKINQWANDKKMKQYIRPETLFGGKFDGYLVQAMEGNLNNDGSENFELNQTEKADLI